MKYRVSGRAWALAVIVAAATAAAGCSAKPAAPAGMTAAETTAAETTAAVETTAAAETAAEETTAAVETTAAETAAAVETTAAAETAAEAETTAAEAAADTEEAFPLSAAKAKATVTLGDTEVILAAEEPFEDLDGQWNSMDAGVFAEENGEWRYLGKVESTSTAYPIAVKDGMLYSASHRAIQKTALVDGELVIAEMASMKFDEKEQATYFYAGEDRQETEDPDGEQFERMFGEYEEAEIVVFE